MDFKASINHKNELVYDAQGFTAKELVSIVKMVRLNQINFKQHYDQSLDAIKEAEKELEKPL